MTKTNENNRKKTGRYYGNCMITNSEFCKFIKVSAWKYISLFFTATENVIVSPDAAFLFLKLVLSLQVHLPHGS